MRKSAFCLTLILSFLASFTFAQRPQDSKGPFINAKGDVYYQGEKVGLVTKEGIIQDAHGKKVAFLNSDGTLSDASGKKMGKVGKNGETFYDASGNLVFTVKDKAGETCDIFDAHGKKIGSVYDGMKGSACAAHCFANGLDASTHQKPKVAKAGN